MRSGQVTLLRMGAAVLPVLVVILALHFLSPTLRRRYREGTLPDGYECLGDRGAYVLYARPDNRAALAAADILDRFTAAVRREYGEALRIEEPDSPFEVIVFSNHDDLSSYARRQLGSDFARNGGFYLAEWRAMGVMGSGDPRELHRPLFHEGTHMILDTFVAGGGHDWSRWLHEGLATYFEASEVRADAIRLGGFDPALVRVLRRNLSADRWIPLDTLFAAGDPEFEGADNLTYYAEAALLVRYLLEAGDPELRRAFLDYLEAERAPGPVRRGAFARIVGDPARIGAAVRRHVIGLR